MTGVLLSPFLQVLFDRVASPAVLKFFKAEKVDPVLLDELEKLLVGVSKVLDDAEVKLITDGRVKKWHEELCDAVYDADDLLDTVNAEAMQRQMEKEFQPKRVRSKLKLKVRNIFKSSSDSKGEIETKLKETLERLEYIVKTIDLLDLKEGVGVAEQPYKKSSTTPLIEERTVYGREDDKETIFKLLLAENSSDDQLGVITITGMGGLGKTTLAQLVYNDVKVDQHFDCKAWVCISEEFDVFKVTRSIVQAVTSLTSVTDELDGLLFELKNYLADKKFLLVLDDVWNEDPDHWKMLKRPLQHGAKGSRILVTTRNMGVAQTMGTVFTHYLRALSEEDCWELFAKHAFVGGESQAHQSFRDIGKNIVKKCGGLPLAAKALGDLLRSKKTIEEWSKIRESNLWDLEDNCSIIPVLRLSYHYLPPRLKCCFAFASIFPKGYEFAKDELILLWAAQSFFPEGVENVEDIGSQYFNELVSRSFFQPSSANSSLFCMHDLLHDLARNVSGQSCHFMNPGDVQEITNTTRHISYSKMGINQFRTLPKTNTSRTFTQLEGGKWIRSRDAYLYPEEISDVVLTRFKSLRVLSLRGYEIRVLPETIGSLKHLRYFDLSRTSIGRLPNSICNLHNLQTLDLTCCLLLTELPTEFWKLVNLEYLSISECPRLMKMPKRLGKLKKLVRLGTFKVGQDSEGANIRELGPLSNLRGELSILNLQNVVSPADAAEARLEDKEYLEKLELSWNLDEDGPREEFEVLEKLQPHRSLKELTIESYGDAKFPKWVDSQMFASMVSLNLKNFKYCRSILKLGQLPSLKELHITGFSQLQKLDSDFYGYSGPATMPFRSLKIMWIKNMPQWEGWFHYDGEAFPLLQELHLENCPKLKRNLPAHLPSLIRFTIGECPQLEASLPGAPALSYLSLQNSNEMLLNHLPQGLQALEIHEFDLLTLLPKAVYSSGLKSVKLDRCNNFKLPMHQEYASLERLTINSCNSLRSFPVQNFPKLGYLEISGCSHLESFSLRDDTTIHEFLSLTHLDISECKRFLGFSDGGLTFPNLRHFLFRYNDEAMTLPNQIQSFQFLRTFSLGDCLKIVALPGGGLPSSLTSLQIFGCDNFVAELLDRGLHGLNSLKDLFISCKCQGLVSFPVEGLLPKSLKKLRIECFDDLETLEYKGFQHLTSLSELTVWSCPKLKCIPPEGLPASLTFLSIEECPLLESRLRRDRGIDWDKIAHIPHILINDREV